MLGWELPPHNSGGLGVACFNLAKALSQQGVEIDFVVPYTAPHEEIDFMKVVSATKVDPLFRYGGSAYDSENVSEKRFSSSEKSEKMSIRDIQAEYCDFVEEYLMEYKPEAVHAHDWLTFEAGMIAKKNFGIPFIAHVHATEYDRSGMMGGNPLIHEIEQEALLMADMICAVSESTKSIIHEKYGIPLSKIVVVYNSLGEDFFTERYNYNADDYSYLKFLKSQGYTVVSTLGRLTVQKGLFHLMRAAKLAISKNPKLMFVLAGSGEERDELIEMSAELGISENVMFTGWVSGKRRRDIYQVSDIFVMSSISEPFGLTALEAAHHKDALILTKQSGVAEVLKSVMTYDFWDEVKLADQILAISKSDALKSELMDGVFKEYRNISWENVANKCMMVYNKFKHNKNELG
jgi:glycosyltransferase involved in cell wall biosynthesis